MRVRLEPEDDLLHEADDDPNFNESRYYSFFDGGNGLGGWMRMGNRPNEGYAEMTVCLYLPDGSVAFMFKRPHIEGHTAHDAGGLRFEALEPFRSHHVTFDGSLCVLAQPRDMADPGTAFAGNPHEPCTIDLHLRSVAQPTGGEPEWDEGEQPTATHQFGRGHTEQQMAAMGIVQIGGQRFDITHGLGLRDHSWGPRIWQSISWYRWLTASFGALGIGCTIRGDADDAAARLYSGHLYDVGRYGDDRSVPVRSIELTTEYDEGWFALRNNATITTDDHAYELSGEIWSSIPLRNRRDGKVTRITEGATRWRCGDLVGAGMSEYLDQIVDDVPIGTLAGA
jgi:hypothetical protein